jgi:hypothetical protein
MKKTPNVVSEVEVLVSALVDNEATEHQISRLESLLVESAEARRTYVTYLAMHADLCYLGEELSQSPSSAGVSYPAGCESRASELA